MVEHHKGPGEKGKSGLAGMYDSGPLKVIALACFSIALSVLLMGGLSYLIVEREAINKLKSKDLIYIVKSVAVRIDGRIDRAKETSLILAGDPHLIEWVEGEEQDAELGRKVLQKITGIAQDYDYDNSFIVSTITNHYWAENSELIDTMSKDDPDDSWFFETIASELPVSIDIDFNNERNDTFVFVNALMGKLEQPIAVTGVGLNLSDIASEIVGYKFGEHSRMWLIDKDGEIHLAEDLEDRGKNISVFVPSSISEKITENASNKLSTAGVLEYKEQDGQMVDLVHHSLQSVDWQLVLLIPRSDSIGFLGTIKTNTLIASTLSLIFIILIFYLISTRIADPFKRAVLLSRELEEKVQERTSELREQNTRIMDSIDYAKRLQETIIPGDSEMSEVFKEHFVIWRPRDLVGGDFYWFKKKGNDYVLAVVDCTGHGVPGALMTMAVSSILNHIVDEVCSDNPTVILKELNMRMKSALHKNQHTVTDDGADIGVCHWQPGKCLTFAGAKFDLYVRGATGLQVIKGDRHSVGYQKSDVNFEYNSTVHSLQDGDKFYLTTDGYIDQNGGLKDHSFGKTRYRALINDYGHLSLAEQRQLFEDALDSYKQAEMQRDDITVVGFQI